MVNQAGDRVIFVDSFFRIFTALFADLLWMRRSLEQRIGMTRYLVCLRKYTLAKSAAFEYVHFLAEMLYDIDPQATLFFHMWTDFLTHADGGSSCQSQMCLVQAASWNSSEGKGVQS